jgi:hypothetical protein
MKKMTLFMVLLSLGVAASTFAEESRDWRQDDGVTEWNETEQEVQSVNAQTDDALGESPVVSVVSVDAELEALRRDYAKQLNALVEQIQGVENPQEAEALELEVRDLKRNEHLAELQYFYDTAMAAGQAERAADLFQILQSGLEDQSSTVPQTIARDSRTGLALDPSQEEGGKQ